VFHSSYICIWITDLGPQRYKEINPFADVSLPDIEPDSGGDHSKTDEELEQGEVKGFRDWNRHIVPVMMGRKLSKLFI
jgi:hypothetical protein